MKRRATDHRSATSGARRALLLASLIAVLAVFSAGGCGGIQSMLEPYGPAARDIATAWWWLFGIAAVVFVLYFGLLALALFPRLIGRDRPPVIADNPFILGGGVILPAVTFVGLIVLAALLTGRVSPPDAPREGQQVIEVTARQWWWEVRYDAEEPSDAFITANEIHIPVDTPVRIEGTSSDVIHAFWVPALHGKIDLIPGHITALELTADQPGAFRGQCSQYCGEQHAKMAFFVVAHEEEDYAAWVQRQREPARHPASAEQELGRRLFLERGCTFCHTVRGIDEEVRVHGRTGPDLTHVASRRTIGAGILDNHQGNIQAWIVGNQSIKPQNHMPEFRNLTGVELRALGTYLRSLE